MKCSLDSVISAEGADVYDSSYKTACFSPFF